VAAGGDPGRAVQMGLQAFVETCRRHIWESGLKAYPPTVSVVAPDPAFLDDGGMGADRHLAVKVQRPQRDESVGVRVRVVTGLKTATSVRVRT